jgi:hypothetical protein
MGSLQDTTHIALEAYIAKARALAIYGGEKGWLKKEWKTTSLRNNVSMTFCELRIHGKLHAVWMESPFLEFAKAYVRYRQYRREVGSIPTTLIALRHLYAGLKQVYGQADVRLIDGVVQEAVRQSVAAWYPSTSGKRYFTGACLMEIYAELKKRAIHLAIPHWENPFPEGKRKHVAMDQTSIDWRQNHTPSDDKLAALLAAFELAKTDKDRYWTSLALLLAFAPSRGGELVDLSLDSLVDEKYTDKYGRTQPRVGVRWFSQKGFDGTIKWVPKLTTSNGDHALETKLQDMVRKAFERLKGLSAPARRAAKLAWDSQGTVYPIHDNCVTAKDYPQDVVLTDVEMVSAIQRAAMLNCAGDAIRPACRFPTRFAWHWPAVEHGNPTYTEIAQCDYQWFSGKIDAWPYTTNSQRVQVWDCLVLHQWNAFNDDQLKTTYPNSWVLPTTIKLCNQLSGRWGKGKLEGSSLFMRLGLKGEDGKDIVLKSHDFRRWHGTRGRALATKGLTEHMLRMVAARQNIRHNDAYDFNTPMEKAQILKKVLDAKELPLHERVLIGAPIYRHELQQRNLETLEVIQAVQISDVGGCTHSTLEPPCDKGGDCLPCFKKKYIKGVPGCLEAMKRQATFHKSEFDALETWQKQRDQLGVDQWMTYHVIRYAIAESLVRQMEDPAIPDGAVLHVDEQFDPSPLKVNLMAKGISVPDKAADPVSAEINQLLGMLSDA